MGISCIQARYRLAQRLSQIKEPPSLLARIGAGVKQGMLGAVTPGVKHSLSLLSRVPTALIESHADAVSDWLFHQPAERTKAAIGLQGFREGLKGFGEGLKEAKDASHGFFSKDEIVDPDRMGDPFTGSTTVPFKSPFARWLSSRVDLWGSARNKPFYQAAYRANLWAEAKALAIRSGDTPQYWLDHATADMVINAKAAADRFTLSNKNTMTDATGAVRRTLDQAAKGPPLRNARSAAELQAAKEGLIGSDASERVQQLLSLKSKDFNQQVTIPRTPTDAEATLAKGKAQAAKVAGLGMDLTVPFAKVMSNIAIAAFDMTPLSVVRTIARTINAEPGSKMGALVAGLTKNTLTAGGAMALGYELARQGAMTGPQPVNPGAGGDEAYRVKIGDHWFSYESLEPLTAGLATGAALYEDTKKNPGNYLKAIQSVGAESIGQVARSTALGSFSGLADATTGKGWDKIPQAAAGIVGEAIPTVVQQAAKGLSGSRESQGFVPQLESKVPGLANTLPKQEDAFGHQRRPGGAANTAASLVIPGGMTPDRTADPVVAEFDRLRVPLTPSKGQASYAHGSVKVALSPEEKNTMLEQVGGPLHTLLAQAIRIPAYQQASDPEKARLLKRWVASFTKTLDAPTYRAQLQQRGLLP